MKLCMIGASGHIEYVLSDLAHAECELIAVAPGSTHENMDPLAQSCAKLTIAPPLYADYRRMLDEQRPEIVAVACHFGDIATVVLEVMRREIHVFAEKPIATTLEDLEQVVETWQNSSVHFSAMLGLRYAPAMYTAWRTLRDGAVGRIRLVSAQKSYRLGQRPEFYRKRRSYGGTIPWVGTHAIDWIGWLSGESFQSVSAAHSAHDNHGHGELEITAAMMFEMTNEVLAVANLDYLRPPTAPTPSDDRVRVAGSHGVLEVRGGHVGLINEESGGWKELELQHPPHGIFADFARQARGEGTSMIRADEVFAVARASLLARQSADEGRRILFD